MGKVLANVRHNPICQAVDGLIKGITYSPDIDDITPLGLATFGFLISDNFANCPSVSTSYSACPSVVTSYSACPTVSTTWSLK